LNSPEDVPDPRRAEGKLYKLQHVLLFSILAIVSGCNSYRGIVTFIDVHRRRLNSVFGLNWRRAPAHIAIRYILKGLDANEVEAAFRRHAAALQGACAGAARASIALDGKTLRGSFDNFHDRAAAQVLSALATDTALVLAHVDIADKSNEIPAVQTLLAELGIAGHLVTLDALHCQKTFRAAAEAGVDLIVQLKDNQPGLHRQVHLRCADAQPLSRASSTDTARNRQERRSVAVFDPADSIADPEWREHVAAIIRDVLTRSAATGMWHRATHTAYHLSNAPFTAEAASAAIRAHWTIENTSHHSRDVTMREDASRIRCNPGVFARLRSFAYNILKANQTGTLPRTVIAPRSAASKRCSEWPVNGSVEQPCVDRREPRPLRPQQASLPE